MTESRGAGRASGKPFSLYNLLAPLVLGGAFYALQHFHLVEAIENLSLDTRTVLRAHDQPPPDPRVILVGIDDLSLATYGKWPWSRQVHAGLAQLLDREHPSVLAWDIIFDTLSHQDPESDEIFANSVRQSQTPSVTGITASDVDSQRKVPDDFDKGWPVPPGFPPNTLYRNDYIILTYPSLLNATRSGIVNIEFTSSGDSNSGTQDRYVSAVVRKIPMVMVAGNRFLPSLALAAIIEHWKLDPARDIRIVPGDAVYIDNPAAKRRIPIDKQGYYFINYRYDLKHLEQTKQVVGYASLAASLLEKLEGRTPKNLPNLENRIFVIGQIAAGLADIGPSPYTGKAPLVLNHTNIIDNILRADFLATAPRPAVWGLFLLLAWLTLILPARQAYWIKIAVPLFLLALYLFACFLLFNIANLVLPLVAPSLAFAFLHIGAVGKQVLEERQAKEELRKTFSAYVAPGILESIYSNPGALQLGGAKKDVTILFSDIRSFTTMTENMDSVVLVQQLNEYFAEMVAGIHNHQGTLHKFIGDAIMAVWGDVSYSGPVVDAGQALRATLAMRQALARLNTRWSSEGRPEFHMGLGLNHGQVVVGNIGAPSRMEFTVIGDAVNLASRLESLNKKFGTEILVGASVHNLAHERFLFRTIGKVQVAGKGVGVDIYEVLCETGRENDSPYDLKWVQLYEEAYGRFRERRFDVAYRLFEACLHEYPNNTMALLMRQTSRDLLAQPPGPDWDGTFEMTSK